MLREARGLRQKLLEVRNQHDVAIEVSAGERELLAIERPCKVKNQVGSEVSKLSWSTASDRLFPQIANTVTGKNIVKRFAVRRPTWSKQSCGRIDAKQRSAAIGGHCG